MIDRILIFNLCNSIFNTWSDTVLIAIAAAGWDTKSVIALFIPVLPNLDRVRSIAALYIQDCYFICMTIDYSDESVGGERCWWPLLGVKLPSRRRRERKIRSEEKIGERDRVRRGRRDNVRVAVVTRDESAGGELKLRERPRKTSK